MVENRVLVELLEIDRIAGFWFPRPRRYEFEGIKPIGAENHVFVAFLEVDRIAGFWLPTP